MKKLLSILAVTVSVIAGSIAGLSLQNVTSVQAAIAPSDAELATARSVILTETNNARAVLGLPPVVANTALNNIAQECSIQQAQNAQMDHCAPYNSYASYPPGWTRAAENVASGQSYNNVVDAWIASPGHYANIIDYTTTDLGIGYYFDDTGRTYFTQNFASYPTTQTIPGSSTTISASPGGAGVANVTWNMPTGNGNSPLTVYELEATSLQAPTVTATVPFNGEYEQSYSLSGLQGGVDYSIRVRAYNALGYGAWSNPASVTTIGVPTVTIGNITTTSTTATIEFTVAPNGSPVSSITVTSSTKPSQTLTGDATTVTLTGLTPGSNTSGQITAVNGAGESVPAAYSFTTQAVAPDAPATTNATVQNKTELKVAWTEPEFNGGSALTSYTARIYDTANQLVAENTVSPLTMETVFTGLTRGETYQYDVTATNIVGSTTGTRGEIVVPYTAPDAVGSVTASLTEEQQITVTWSAPVDDGGVELDTYNLAIYENGSKVSEQTVFAPNTSIVLNAPTIKAATDYSFTVTAHNTADLTSTPTFSNTVVVPAAPTAPGVVQEVTVSNITQIGFRLNWSAPSTNGGAPITAYKWQALTTDNMVVSEGETLAPVANVTGLDHYTTYNYRIVAVNRVGESVAATGTVTTLASVPATPTVTDTTPLGPDSIAVTVTTADDGGDPNITYTVKLLDGATIVDTQTSSGYTVFNNVELNKTYNVEITATNTAGTSPVGTGTVQTATTSDPVTGLTTTNTVDDLTVNWTAPINTGTYSITGYTVNIYSTDGTLVTSQTAPQTATSSTFALTMQSVIKYGTGYVVEVIPYTHETHIPGSAATVETTTVTRAPFATTNVNGTVNVTDRSVTVTWAAPTNDGGAPVTGYDVSLETSSNQQVVEQVTVIGLTHTFTGLQGNMDYTVTVKAVNNTGAGDPTEYSFNSGVFAPAAPTVTGEYVSDTTVNFTITPNTDTGGSALTGFNYRVFNVTDNVAETNWMVQPVTDPTVSFTTGVNGKTYRLDVQAVNVSGNSPVASSNTVQVPVVAPGPVTNITVTNITSTDATVSWTNPTFNGGANLTQTSVTVRDSLGGVAYFVLVPGNQTTTPIGGLSEYAIYQVEISTSNGVLSSPTTTAAFRSAFAAANAPVDVTFTLTTPTSVAGTIAWTAPVVNNPDAFPFLRYDVELVDTTTGTSTYTTGLTVTELLVTDLTRGHVYEAKVTAHYGSPATVSPTVTTSPVEVVITAPTAPAFTSVTWNGLTPTYAWSAPTDNGGENPTYTVTVVNADGYSETITTSSTTVVGAQLEPGTQYTVTVTAVNSAGSSPETTNVFETAVIPPTVPLNVSVSADKYAQTVTVSYDPPANNGGGTVSYEFKLFTSDNVLVAAQTTPVFTGVTRDRTYYATVTAINSAGVSPTATTSNVTVDPVEPSAPQNVTVQPVGNGTTDMQVTWAAPTDNGGAVVSSYKVTVYDDAMVQVSETVVDASITTFTVTGLNPVSDYLFTVGATNRVATTVSTAVAGSTPMVAPSPVRNVTATVDQNTATITTTFDSPVNDGGGVVTYDATVTAANGDVVWSGLVNSGFSVQVNRGVSYTVNVVAKNLAGSSAPGVSNNVTVDAVAPDAPTNLTATVADDNTVQLRWTPPAYDGGAAVTGYTYQILSDTVVVREGSTVDQTQAIISGLEPNKTFTVNVVAHNSAGSSPVLTVANLFTTRIIKATFTLDATTILSDSFSYNLNVTNMGGVSENELTLAVELQDKDGNVIGTRSTDTGTFGGLTHATEYVLVGSVTNSAGTVTLTSVVKTAPIVATAPTNVVATVTGPQSAKVSWDAPSDDGGAPITGYTVEYHNNNGNVSGVVEATGVTVDITGLPLGEVYTFVVKAVNQAGQSVPSTESNTIETAPSSSPTLLTEEELMALINNGDLVPFTAQVAADGNTLMVTVNDTINDTWVYGAAYSEPVGLGWAYGTNGNLTYNISDVPAGNHNIALYAADGKLIGYAPFVVTETPVTETPATAGTGSNSTSTTGTTELSRTGVDNTNMTWLILWIVGLGFIGIGGVLIALRNKLEPARNRNNPDTED